MTELKKKGLVGSSSDLANILNKVSSTAATIAGTTAMSAPSASQVTIATTPTYAQLTAHSGVPNIPNMSLPPPRFAHGYYILFFLLGLFIYIIGIFSSGDSANI